MPRRPRRPPRALLACLVALLYSSWADAVPLFVQSSPPGATVTIGEVTFPGRTPLLERDFEPGVYTVLLELDGFVDAAVDVTVSEGQAATVNVELKPDYVLTAFPEDLTFVGIQGEVARAGYARIPQGEYSITRSDGVVFLSPRYPNQRWIDATTAGAAVSLVAALASAAVDASRASLMDETVSPLTAGLAGVAAGFAAADLILYFDRNRFIAQHTAIRVDRLPGIGDAFLERSEAALEDGDVDEAERNLSEYIRLFPDGESVPQALYRRGRLYFTRGEVSAAIADFQRILSEYPAPDVYDRAVVGLAEAYRDRKMYEEARETLDRLIHVFPVPSYEEVDFLRGSILEDMAAAGLPVTLDRVTHWREMAGRNRDSSDYLLYRALLANALIDAGQISEAESILDDIGTATEENLAVYLQSLRKRLIERHED